MGTQGGGMGDCSCRGAGDEGEGEGVGVDEEGVAGVVGVEVAATGA